LGPQVKRALLTLAVAVLAVLGAVAAPALSVRPYRPTAVDFELAPAGGVRAAGGGRVASAPLRTSKRFNLVGLRWRGSAKPKIALRARRDGGSWSRWVPLEADPADGPDPGGEGHRGGASAPLWVGQADWVQYRLSRPVPGLRLHFVNATGTATAKDRALTAVRRTVSAGVVALGGLVGSAEAESSQPEISPRSDWGADGCPPRDDPSYGDVKAVFVHHTVTTNSYSPEDVPAMILSICRYHRNSNGWDDIGYNYLVDRFGHLWEGRAGGIDRAVVGAQAAGYNSETSGIANLGTFSDVPETDAALDAMAKLIRWKLPLHGKPTAGQVTVTSHGGSSNRYRPGAEVTIDRVSGHRDVDATACPGATLYSQLDELRRRVGDVRPTGQQTTISLAVRPPVVIYPKRALVVGRLTTEGGAPIAGVKVDVQKLLGRGWKKVARRVTKDDGSFEAGVGARGNRTLRANFRGAGEALPTSSLPIELKVKPAVTIKPPATQSAAGQALLIKGRVRPRKRRVIVMVSRLAGETKKRVARLKVTTNRKGRFRRAYTPRRAGTYRFYVLVPRDQYTSRGRSSLFFVNAA
jgi:5-hydroxyisourate hydrolase-like protein (transthyretin family)